MSVVIVNWNGAEYLEGCLESIRGVAETIVVDNGSTDGSVALVRRLFPDVVCVENQRNLGFSAANNVGARRSSGGYLLFLNNDTIVKPGAPALMRGALERDPRIAIVGGRLETPEGRPQVASAGRPPSFAQELRRIFSLGRADRWVDDDFRYDVSQDATMVCGAALMIRRSVLEDLGGWPEEYFAYAEDAELCRRAIARGYRVWFESSARIVHFGGGSGKRAGLWRALRAHLVSHRSVNLYIRRHEGTGRALVHAALLPVDLLIRSVRRVGRGGVA